MGNDLSRGDAAFRSKAIVLLDGAEIPPEMLVAGMAAYEEWERVTGRDSIQSWITPWGIEELVRLIARSIIDSQRGSRAFEQAQQDRQSTPPTFAIQR